MNTRQFRGLLLFVAILWLAPWIGKQHWPSVMGSIYVQWPCATLNALLLPLGLFLGLRLLFLGIGRRSHVFWMSMAFLLMFMINLMWLGVGYWTLSDTLIVGADLGIPQPWEATDEDRARVAWVMSYRAWAEAILMEFRWMVCTHLVGFFAVFAGGMAIVALRRPVEDPDADGDQSDQAVE